MASNINNNDLKHYFKEIKVLLPIKGELEKKFIADLESNVQEHFRDNLTVTKKDLYDHYGTPTEVVANYFESVDTNRLLKRIQIFKWIRIICTIFLIFLISFIFFRGMLIYKDYIAGQNAHITIKETIIENE